jgi:hypothetical protein
VPGFTLRVVLTFHLWCFSLIFFRAATLADAVTFIEGLGAGVAWSEAAFLAGLSWTELIAITVPAVALSGLEFSQGERTWLEFLDRRPVLVSVILQLLMFYSILTLGVMDSQQFVYFQF